MCELLKMEKPFLKHMYFKVCFRIPRNSNNVINTLSWLTNFHVIGEEVWRGGGGEGEWETEIRHSNTGSPSRKSY